MSTLRKAPRSLSDSCSVLQTFEVSLIDFVAATASGVEDLPNFLAVFLPTWNAQAT